MARVYGMVALGGLLAAASGGEELQLVVSGECPGPWITTAAGVTAQSPVELYWGSARGEGSVPDGPCAGTELGLADPALVAEETSDLQGRFFIFLTLPPGPCGRLLQVVDQATCGVTGTAWVEDAVPGRPAVTGQLESFEPGDDGDLRKGVAWPRPRFVDEGDGTVTDRSSGLRWLRDAGCVGALDWHSALDATAAVADGICGLTDGSAPGDWRLPNVEELYTLVDFGNFFPALPPSHPFVGVESEIHWTSTSKAQQEDRSWHVDFFDGTASAGGRALELVVWPVRGPENAPPGGGLAAQGGPGDE